MSPRICSALVWSSRLSPPHTSLTVPTITPCGLELQRTGWLIFRETLPGNQGLRVGPAHVSRLIRVREVAWLDVPSTSTADRSEYF